VLLLPLSSGTAAAEDATPFTARAPRKRFPLRWGRHSACRDWALLLLVLLLSCGTATAEDATPFTAVAALASALSQNDANAALAAFDPDMKERGAVERDITALAAQSDILCAIDVVDERDQDGERVLDVDWYMRLQSQSPAGSTERRRQRVLLHVKKTKGKWKITAISPLAILAPLSIH